MSGAVGVQGTKSIDSSDYYLPGGSAQNRVAPSVLPAPKPVDSMVAADLMLQIAALTSEQGHVQTTAHKEDVKGQQAQRKIAEKNEQEQIQKAKDAKESGGIFSEITDAVGLLGDVVVGAATGCNPLTTVCNYLAEKLDLPGLKTVGDIVAFDSVLRLAATGLSEATGDPAIRQAYDLIGPGTGLKEKFQGLADLTGEKDVMKVYSFVKDSALAVAITVATCGTGTVAIAAALISVGLAMTASAEGQFHYLEACGVSAEVAGGLQIGMTLGSAASGCVGAFATNGALLGAKVAAVVKIVDGSTKVLQGAATTGHAVIDKIAADHMIESKVAQNQQKQIDRSVEHIITSLRAVMETYQKSSDYVTSALQQRDETRVELTRHYA